MPKLSGVFQIFTNLDSTPPQAIFRWLTQPISLYVLENSLANRLLFPQSVPVTTQDMAIDLAILKEGISQNSQIFYNNTLKQITIPEGFEERFKPLEELIKAYIDALNLTQTTLVTIKKTIAEHLEGWIMIPPIPLKAPESLHITSSTSSLSAQTHQATQNLEIAPNNFYYFPEISNCSASIKIGNSTQIDLIIGNLGLIVDTRPRIQTI